MKNKVIWKYNLDVSKLIDAESYLILRIPKGSDIISVIEQRGMIVLYAHVDPEEKETDVYKIYLHETGRETKFSKKAKFIGTVKVKNGMFIFHILAEKEAI